MDGRIWLTWASQWRRTAKTRRAAARLAKTCKAQGSPALLSGSLSLFVSRRVSEQEKRAKAVTLGWYLAGRRCEWCELNAGAVAGSLGLAWDWRRRAWTVDRRL